jgi:hypothetical protein
VGVETVVKQLMALKARPVLIRAARAGIITELRCAMKVCYCPRGRGYFQLAESPGTDWRPTNDHYPILACDGGRETIDNSRLAHRLCNRVDYSRRIGRSHASDLARVEAARRAWFPLQDAS